MNAPKSNRTSAAASEAKGGDHRQQRVHLIDDILRANDLSTSTCIQSRSVGSPRRGSINIHAGLISHARIDRDGAHDYVVVTYELLMAGLPQSLRQRIRLTTPIDQALQIMGVMSWPRGGVQTLRNLSAIVRIAEVQSSSGATATVVSGLLVTPPLKPLWEELRRTQQMSN